MDTFKLDAKVIQDGGKGYQGLDHCQSGKSPTISRVFSKSHQCKAWGDPHFVALNGKKFDYQGVGDYLLLNSDRLVVQAKFIPFVRIKQSPKTPKKLSSTTAVAFKYDDSSYIVTLKGKDKLVLKVIKKSIKKKFK